MSLPKSMSFQCWVSFRWMKSPDVVLISKLTQTWGKGPLLFDFYCRRRKLLPTFQDRQTWGTRDSPFSTKRRITEHQLGVWSFPTLGWLLCSRWHAHSPLSEEVPFPLLTLVGFIPRPWDQLVSYLSSMFLLEGLVISHNNMSSDLHDVPEFLRQCQLRCTFFEPN